MENRLSQCQANLDREMQCSVTIRLIITEMKSYKLLKKGTSHWNEVDKILPKSEEGNRNVEAHGSRSDYIINQMKN